MKKTLLVAIFFISIFHHKTVSASFFIQHSTSYYTHDDNVDELKYLKMNNFSFIGASLDKKRSFFLGQSLHIWNKEHKDSNDSTQSTISITELGPRALLFLDDSKSWVISGTFNPYAKGTRTVKGISQEVSGMSYLVSFAYQIKVTKKFHLGASVNYHSLSISKKVVSEQETSTSDTYTNIIPMLDLSIRFN